MRFLAIAKTKRFDRLYKVLTEFGKKYNRTPEHIARLIIYDKYKSNLPHERIEQWMVDKEAINARTGGKWNYIYMDTVTYDMIHVEWDKRHKNQKGLDESILKCVYDHPEIKKIMVATQPKPENINAIIRGHHQNPAGNGFREWKYSRNGRGYNK